MNLFPMCVIALAQTGLLYFFVRKDAQSLFEKPWKILVVAVLFFLVQYTSAWRDMLFYVHVLLLYLVSGGIILMWTGKPWMVCFQRAAIWQITTGALLQSLSYLSQKVFAGDVFRDGEVLPLLLAANILLFLAGMALLHLLLLMLPSRARATPFSLLLVLLSALPYLFVRQITFWLPIEVEQVTPAVVVTLLLSAVLMLLMDVILERMMQTEEEKRQALAMKINLEQQKKHYEVRKTSIEAVRRQYHDVKNLALYLKKAPGKEQVEVRLQEMLSDMAGIETLIETGNEALDIILADKLERCRQKGIPCQVMMDGALFSFLDPLDLVAMMGNILDNAIEASEKCAKEKRFIRLRSAQRAGLVLLSAENSCLEQLRVSSLPGTDKADRENHGFGLKNIQDTARRYDGEMHCEAEAGTFTLTLLFPRDDT